MSLVEESVVVRQERVTDTEHFSTDIGHGCPAIWLLKKEQVKIIIVLL